MSIKKILSLVSAYKIEAIAIGNGTASRETEDFIKWVRFENDIQVLLSVKPGHQYILLQKSPAMNSLIMM